MAIKNLLQKKLYEAKRSVTTKIASLLKNALKAISQPAIKPPPLQVAWRRRAGASQSAARHKKRERGREQIGREKALEASLQKSANKSRVLNRSKASSLFPF